MHTGFLCTTTSALTNNLRRFVYSLRSFNECFFYLLYSLLMIKCALKLPAKCFLLILNLCVAHTCNCIVQSLEIHLFSYSCKGQGLHKLHHYVMKYHSNVVFHIRRLEPSKVCSNPVHLFMH